MPGVILCKNIRLKTKLQNLEPILIIKTIINQTSNNPLKTSKAFIIPQDFKLLYDEENHSDLQTLNHSHTPENSEILFPNTFEDIFLTYQTTVHRDPSQIRSFQSLISI